MSFPSAPAAARRDVPRLRAKLSQSARLLAGPAPTYRLGVVSNFYGNLSLARLPEVLG